MLVDKVRELTPIEQLCYWIHERHQIFLRRRQGRRKPWTDDEVLQTCYFTNPYRENDKVTSWLRDNIRDPLKEDKKVLFAITCFRWFNWIPTGEVLMGKGLGGSDLTQDWNVTVAVGRLNAIQQLGEQVFTGAFNISNSGSRQPKIQRVCEGYVQPAWEACKSGLEERLWNKQHTLKEVFNQISRLPGLGGSGFMCGQIICDLKFTKYLESAPDWWDWCTPGPGSIRGMNRMLGRPVDGPPPSNFLQEINKLREMIHKRLPKYPRFCAQNVQNICCEVDKYLRVLNGEGQSKRRYKGR